ncbi:HD domain-containing phosphohydrolase [Aeromonas cavernicola]|uniref:Phosphodiesterase n=1 Tax=Aeromonas cavernicola TaxID=1006623 RepID=A0A2H9U1C6_9GAMM|nr:HD domain-containing phosphohydrolase [Aeromonas cavernicola]PJG57852.1 phosphodiesterase [Aeromonas cavernicola]
MDDNILIIDDGDLPIPDTPQGGWKVMIVDDEPEVHHITTITLNKFIFDDRPISFFHAYSAADAKEQLLTNPDIALLLLDVVMETDHSGLDVVKFIRDDLQNKMVRIVLRTGQPGQAPEDDVVNNYDINDYKDKTELTSQKLRTLLRASLRSYRDICILESHRKGLEKVIAASKGIFEKRALRQFVEGAQEQLGALLYLGETQIYDVKQCAYEVRDQLLEPLLPGLSAILLSEAPAILRQAMALKSNIYAPDQMVLYCQNSRHHLLFHIEIFRPLSQIDTGLLSLFTENIVVALENIRLNEVIADNQREIIYRIGELIETRSKESGLHVKRVALYTEQFCLLLGMSEEQSELIKRASPLHDIGKVGIPDAVLQKPGKFTPEEWDVMKTHAQLGQDMLSGSNLTLFQIGATIAGNHHEKWDGNGYPRGLQGTDIPLEGRIVALADVFDALCSDRCYKRAWPLDDVLAFIEQEKGKHFDPTLVTLMMANLDKFLAIRDEYKDVYLGEHYLSEQ